MKVEVAVLGSPSLAINTVRTISVVSATVNSNDSRLALAFLGWGLGRDKLLLPYQCSPINCSFVGETTRVKETGRCRGTYRACQSVT